MDNIDNVAEDENDTIPEDVNRFLESVIKLEQFDKEDINQQKSEIWRLFLLKYKCIFIISGVATGILTFAASLLSISMSVLNIDNKSNYTEIVNILLSLINVTNNQSDNSK